MRKSLTRRAGWGAWLVVAMLAGCEAEGVITEPRLGALEYVAGNNQIGTVGLNLATQLMVRLVDQNGNPIAGEQVVFHTLQAGSTASPLMDSTGADGIATTQFRLGPVAQTYTLVAKWVFTGGETGQFVTFTATAEPAPPAALTIIGGNNQTRPAGTTLPIGLSVRAADAFGNPTPDVPVTFAIASGGGVVSASTVTTNASGVASTIWTLGPMQGSQGVIAFTAGVTPISFVATAQ